MANNVNATIGGCQSCVRNGTRNRRRRPLQLFPASETLKFIAKNILGLLPKLNQGNYYNCVIKDRYSKPTRAILVSRTSFTPMANICLEHWIVPLGIITYLWTDSEPKFESKYFSLVFGYLGVTHLMATAYHPQNSGHTEYSIEPSSLYSDTTSLSINDTGVCM